MSSGFTFKLPLVMALILGTLFVAPDAVATALRSVDVFRQADSAFVGPVFDRATYEDTTLYAAGTGASVAGAGDVNGDGRPDLLVGMPGFINARGEQTGAAFVTFGRPPMGSLELSALGRRGFTIYGVDEGDLTGAVVDRAGDFNGDGLEDMLVTAPKAAAGRGSTYIVFGSRSGGDVDLRSLGDRGLHVDGSFAADEEECGADPSACELSAGSQLGSDAGPAGDVNGDRLDDVVVAAVGADQAAVVFGRPTGGRIGFHTAGAGFLIDGLTRHAGVDNDYLPIAGPGDVNHDRRADVLVGADPTWGGDCGRCTGNAYLVFGSSSPRTVRVDRLGRRGLRIFGGIRREGVGYDVAGPGDVNGDRRPDLLIGTSRSAVVVFGRRKPGRIRIDRLGRHGFLLKQTGVGQVDAIGDWNRDRLADFSVARTVVYGKRSRRTLFVKRLRRGFHVGNGGFCLASGSCPGEFPDNHYRLTGAGDLNRDGRDDIVLGDASTGPRERGGAFVLYAAGPPLAAVTQRRDRVPVSRVGAVHLRVLCPANTVRHCAGVVNVTARRGSGTATVLRARFRARAGFYAEVSEQVSGWVLRRLRGGRRLQVAATTRARDARGRRSSTRRELVLTRR